MPVRLVPDLAEMSQLPAVLAFDPGGTTGWSVMTVHPVALLEDDYAILDNIDFWEQGQIEGSEHDQITEIIHLVEVWDTAAVVMEDFQLRTLAAELSPTRIEAVVSWYMQTQLAPARPLFKQMPSLAKSTVTDDRLKAWGYYRPGQEHARDATRHVITFLRRLKEKPALRAHAWDGAVGLAEE